MRVVVAPDSFKGTISATDAASAIAAGWSAARPGDEVLERPQADGGEGTLAALAAGDPGAVHHRVTGVPGPDGRPVTGAWLRLGDGSAAVELAQVVGLPLLSRPDPLHSSTRGLGVVMAAALRTGVRRLLVGLGGSASTDGGAGLLTGLGARLTDAEGVELPDGGAALARLARCELDQLPRDVEILALTDVDAPLLGPDGAAAVYGPQKGAGPAEIETLEAGVRRLAEVLGGDPEQPGAGAAGGTAYGLVTALGARIEPGAPGIARGSGLVEAAASADVLITGEGRFDATSLRGKVVGHALGLPGPAVRIVIAGVVAEAPSGATAYALTDLAGDTAAAVADPARWLRTAATRAALELRSGHQA